MKLICSTTYNGDYNADVDLMVLDLTPELARTIYKRWMAFTLCKAEDSELVSMKFWDYSPDWHEWGGDEDYPDDFVDDDKVDSFNLGQQCRVECGQMIISTHGVFWACYPKHCDVKIESRTLDIDSVREAAGLSSDGDWPWCESCDSYHHPNNPTCKG